MRDPAILGSYWVPLILGIPIMFRGVYELPPIHGMVRPHEGFYTGIWLWSY